MTLVRFIGLLFVLIGVLTNCAATVVLLLLMLRFWPLALAIGLALILFNRLLQQIGVCILRSAP